ncbi:MAG: hypothetical protein D8M58_06205 [Calditrichaeota bacterium]|nr:MAG: hypothetical protein DWQ03_20300 [Calditrichota bacterium]MBL1204972.1 hypothetical protein [Calditrichota bacterium]NOG44802.1 DUF4145 domain-containing protein [Calditrichota bacterium]
MKSKILLIIFSILSFVLLVLHLVFPNFKIDTIALSLFILAFLPWILPYLKNLELPGGIKIELRDIKEATEKVTGKLITVSGKIEEESSMSANPTVISPDPMAILLKVAEHDPNLGLIGFRIELEKRILDIAQKNSIESRLPLFPLLRSLYKKNIITENVFEGLKTLIDIANHAAHGEKVNEEAVHIILNNGAQILKNLKA